VPDARLIAIANSHANSSSWRLAWRRRSEMRPVRRSESDPPEGRSLYAASHSGLVSGPWPPFFRSSRTADPRSLISRPRACRQTVPGPLANPWLGRRLSVRLAVQGVHGRKEPRRDFEAAFPRRKLSARRPATGWRPDGLCDWAGGLRPVRGPRYDRRSSSRIDSRAEISSSRSTCDLRNRSCSRKALDGGR